MLIKIPNGLTITETYTKNMPEKHKSILEKLPEKYLVASNAISGLFGVKESEYVLIIMHNSTYIDINNPNTHAYSFEFYFKNLNDANPITINRGNIYIGDDNSIAKFEMETDKFGGLIDIPSSQEYTTVTPVSDIKNVPFPHTVYPTATPTVPVPNYNMHTTGNPLPINPIVSSNQFNETFSNTMNPDDSEKFVSCENLILNAYKKSLTGNKSTSSI